MEKLFRKIEEPWFYLLKKRGAQNLAEAQKKIGILDEDPFLIPLRGRATMANLCEFF
jgi:hypothetical protein